MDTVTAKIDINYPAGPKVIEAILKPGYEIEECEHGKVVCLNLVNGEMVTGIFKGISDEDVRLGSLNGKHVLGYNIYWVKDYFEEIKGE